MGRMVIRIPHEVCKYTCTANGLRDVYIWKTGQYLPCEFMIVLSGFADFVYLKNRKMTPPRMVFWARGVKEHYKGLERIFDFKINIKEGQSFSFALESVKEHISKGNPVIIGPLDLFHIEYRPDLFHRVHTAAHFVLVVGYDDEEEKVFVHDCDLPGVQSLSYENLRLAWGKDEPGYIKRNAVITFQLLNEKMGIREVVRRALLFKAEQMLSPRTKNYGILGMRKLAQEFPSWEKHLDEEAYKAALELMAMYSNTPPTLAEGIDNFTGKRRELAITFREITELTNDLFFDEVAKKFVTSGESVSEIAHIIIEWLKGGRDRREEIPNLLREIADIENEAYEDIKRRYGR